MKILAAVVLAFVSTMVFAGKNTFSVGDGRTPDFEKYKRLKVGLRSHHREVRTDYDTIPGSVIHWYSDGLAETNVIRFIDSVVQTNSYENVMIRLDATNNVLVALNTQLESEVTKWMAQSASFSNMVVITQGRLDAASEKINSEVKSLKEEKTDLEEKIADSKYILLRPWLKTKLALVETRIQSLEILTSK